MSCPPGLGRYVFANAVSFNQGLATWDLAGVKVMDHVFTGAAKFNQPLEAWHVEPPGARTVQCVNPMERAAASVSFGSPARARATRPGVA